MGEDPNSGSNSPSPDANLARHPIFKEEFNPSAHDESLESYFAARRVRPAHSTPTASPSPVPPSTGPGSAPNSSVKASEAGKKQRHKEKLKLAWLVESDGSALTQSGDEAEGSSPPPQDRSGPGTEVGTEVGEEGDVEMAERSSPGEFSFATCDFTRMLTPRAIKNLCRLRRRRRLRKVPKRVHQRVPVRVRPLHPPEAPKNESGRPTCQLRTVRGI